jgi:hypothetical protein
MKKLITLAALALLLMPGLSMAQKNVLKFDLGSTPAGQYSLLYERAIVGRLSAQLGAGIISYDGNQFFSDGTALTRFSSQTFGAIVTPELRYYLKNDAPRGLYVNGYGRFRSATKFVEDQSFPMNTDVSHSEHTVTMGGGAGLGLHVLILRTLSLDMNIGPQFKDRRVSRNYYEPNVTDDDFRSKFLDLSLGDKRGMALRAQFTLGVAF